MLRKILLAGSHLAMLGIGFAAGVYTLPILTAPKGPDNAALQATAAAAMFKGRFDRNLKGSDFLHWGEGEVRVLKDMIAHEGRLSPGPDYKLYLTTEFVDTKESFLTSRPTAHRLGDVRSFNGFLLPVPPDVDVTKFTTVVIWCEAFGAFISAAKYR